MSSMIHKVKDVLKSDHNSSTDPTSTGQHGQTSSTMPGTFDSTTGDTTGKGYGTAHSTDPRLVQTTGTGHEAAYQPATTGHGTSRYASEPSQGSYAQDHGTIGTHTTTHTSTHGAGYGTGAGVGTAGIATTALGGHSSRKQVPDSKLMDPADRSHDANIMDRSRDNYGTGENTGLTHSGSSKLHKNHDPRGNYDNSARSARADQDATLNREQQAGYSDTTRQSGYGDTTENSGQPLHNSKLMNKLDPRVDNQQIPDRDSKYSDRDSGHSGAGYGAGAGATAAAATAYGTHGSHKDRNDRSDYSSREAAKDHYGGTHGTTDRTPALPTRTRDEVERGDLSRDPRHNDYSTTNDPRYGTTGISNPISSSTHHSTSKDHRTSQAIPYSMSGAHTEGHDPLTTAAGAIRSHFHCMGCGHKNDASHLRDMQGARVTGRTDLHCMNCGHRNQVGHLLK